MVRHAAVLAACAACALVALGCGTDAEPAGSATAPPPATDGIDLEEAQRQPPPPVTRLEAVAEAGSVHLRWPASPDVVYRVLRTDDGGERELGIVRVDAPGETRWRDDAVATATTYRYRVVPENRWGLAGEPSPEVTVSTG